MSTLKEITNNYNSGISALNTYTNSQMIAISKMPVMIRMKNLKQLQEWYKKNVTNLDLIRKNSIKNLNKMIQSALIVGINYTGFPYQLNGCINDAITMQGFANIRGCDNIIMMTDKSMYRPTKNNIIVGLSQLLKNAKSGDVVMFYYSGHGTNVLDKNGDETDGLDECMVTLDGQLITDDDLNLVIKTNLKTGVTLLIVCDCCHSGTMLDLKYNYNEDMNTVKDMDLPGKVIYISGCRDAQTSIETFMNGKSQGALTGHLMNVLNETPDLFWKTLMDTLRSRLTGFQQLPQLSSSCLINLNEKTFI